MKFRKKTLQSCTPKVCPFPSFGTGRSRHRVSPGFIHRSWMLTKWNKRLDYQQKSKWIGLYMDLCISLNIYDIWIHHWISVCSCMGQHNAVDITRGWALPVWSPESLISGGKTLLFPKSLSKGSENQSDYQECSHDSWILLGRDGFSSRISCLKFMLLSMMFVFSKRYTAPFD